jgi:hypothetical protein
MAARPLNLSPPGEYFFDGRPIPPIHSTDNTSHSRNNPRAIRNAIHSRRQLFANAAIAASRVRS